MRKIYCLYCGDRFKRDCEKYGEDYRAVEGEVNRNKTCDGCNKELPEGSTVIAATQHPGGSHAIGPWELDYIR